MHFLIIFINTITKGQKNVAKAHVWNVIFHFIIEPGSFILQLLKSKILNLTRGLYVLVARLHPVEIYLCKVRHSFQFKNHQAYISVNFPLFITYHLVYPLSLLIPFSCWRCYLYKSIRFSKNKKIKPSFFVFVYQYLGWLSATMHSRIRATKFLKYS